MDNDPEPVQTQKKEKPLNELLTSRIADIYVGPESTHWPLHERLLCYHSPFLARIFYKDDNDNDTNGEGSDRPSARRGNKSYGFPDEEDQTFTLLVGWLYSRSVPAPTTERSIGPLLDLYLLAQKLEIEPLSTDVVSATREFYHTSSTYPGLRRVQYIYGNTDEDNEMREMMVSSVARQLATTERVPAHWASALHRNGQLAVDIIRAIQRWNIEEKSIPDIRDGGSSIGSSRGRKDKGGFSAVEREGGESVETEVTGMTGSVSLGSNLGVESVTSEATSRDLGHDDDRSVQRTGGRRLTDLSTAGGRDKDDEAEFARVSKAVEAEAEPLTVYSLSLLQARLKRPPSSFLCGISTTTTNNIDISDTTSVIISLYDSDSDSDSDSETMLKSNTSREPRRKASVTFKPEVDVWPAESRHRERGRKFRVRLRGESEGRRTECEEKEWRVRLACFVLQRWESSFLLILWTAYVWYWLCW